MNDRHSVILEDTTGLDDLTYEKNSTISGENDDKSNVHAELVGLFYVVGIIGSFLALLHLNTKKNFRNTKQAFMLK